MANTHNPSERAKDAAHQAADRAKDTAHGAADRAKEAATTYADKAKEAASNVADRAREMATGAGDRARQAASYVGERAEDATGRVGSGMESLAGSIRESAPGSGYLGTAAARVADSLESGGRYLQEEGLKGVADDLTEMIKRNPIPALLVGIGVGFLLARATSSRS